MSQEAENIGSDVRAEDAFDVASVDAELKKEIVGLKGQPEVRQFSSGASNLTFMLRYPDRDLVLRRPPSGAKPKSGHSMIREYSVMKALQPQYPKVPEVFYYASHEDSVIGAEFYVMEKVPGRLVLDKFPDEWNWGPDEVRSFCERFWDKLIELHSIDPSSVGLQDFGKPDGYVERQILGWNSRYERALTPDADPFEDVRRWLEDNRPKTESGSAILHGDFRIDNMILDENAPHEISAVLDWEISALGDPLMDLGASLAYWIQADDPPELQVLKRQPSDVEGMMTRDEIVEYYAKKSGIKIDNYLFYYVYGQFRLAGIAQQIYYRYYHKQTTNKRYALFGPGAKNLGNYVRKLIREQT